MLPEGDFLDVDGDRVFCFSRRGERLRRSPIKRLRRRQDVAGVGVVDRVLDREVCVLISEISVTVRDQRVSVQDFKDGAETEGHAPRAGRVPIEAAGREVPTGHAARRVACIDFLAPGIHVKPIPKLVMCAVEVGRVFVCVQIGGDRGWEARDDLLAGDEPVPLVISGRSARVGVSVAVVAASCEDAALVFCAVDGDGLACDVAL